MAEAHRYKKQSDTVWVREDDPEGPATRLARRPHAIYWTVTRWAISHSVAGQDTTKEREFATFYQDEARGARLWCTLDNDRRRFNSLAEDGTKPIKAPIEFSVVGSDKVEIEGALSHHEDYTSEHSGEHFTEGLSAVLSIPQDRFDYLVEQLHRVGARLRVSLAIQLFKEGVADSFDEDWMTQDFYVPRGEYVKIEHYYLAAVSGTDADQKLGLVADDENEADDEETPAFIGQSSQSKLVAPVPDRRLTYIVWLLAALLLVQLFRG